MRRLQLVSLVAIVVVLSVGVISAATFPQVKWQSSAAKGVWRTGGFYINNNMWNQSAGPQRIWADSYDFWGVQSTQWMGDLRVKSFPCVEKDFNNVPVSSFRTLRNGFTQFMPTISAQRGAEAADDVWLDEPAHRGHDLGGQSGPDPGRACRRARHHRRPALRRMACPLLLCLRARPQREHGPNGHPRVPALAGPSLLHPGECHRHAGRLRVGDRLHGRRDQELPDHEVLADGPVFVARHGPVQTHGRNLGGPPPDHLARSPGKTTRTMAARLTRPRAMIAANRTEPVW